MNATTAYTIHPQAAPGRRVPLWVSLGDDSGLTGPDHALAARHMR